MTTRWIVLALTGTAVALGAQEPPPPPTPPTPPPRTQAPTPPAPRERTPRPVRAPAPADIALPALTAQLVEVVPLPDVTLELMKTDMDLLAEEVRLQSDLVRAIAPSVETVTLEAQVLSDALTAQHIALAPHPEPIHDLFEPLVHGIPGGLHFEEVRARAPWAPQDVGDSLYREAREVMNRGDWGQAARLFGTIPERYPNSAYAAQALYYQALSLYRIGGTDELRRALDALNVRESKYPNVRSSSDDVRTLATRIRGVLAQRGDQQAAQELARTAAQGRVVCDREEQAVQAEAMNALVRTDAENANALIRRVLARRDECSVALRRSAVLLAANRRDAESSTILIDVARNDPDADVRTRAILALSRLPGEESLPVLEELVRTDKEERIQRAAVRALVQHPSARARTVVRALVDREDVSERIRSEALSAFSPERATADDVAWLQSLYARLQSTSLKQRALSAITRIGGNEVDQWLITIVRNDNEPSSVRATAMRRIGRTLPIADLGRLYDSASQQRLRLEIISVLGHRTEDAATDKLIDIAKNGTDPTLRTRAIRALSEKDDERTRALLLDIVSRPPGREP